MKGINMNTSNTISVNKNQYIKVKNNVITRRTDCTEFLYYKENMYLANDTLDDLAILQKFCSVKYMHHFNKRRAIPLSKYKTILQFKTLYAKSLPMHPVY